MDHQSGMLLRWVMWVAVLAGVLRLGYVGVNAFASDEARVSLLALKMARQGEIACDEILFARLRDLRKKLADERGVCEVSERARDPERPHELVGIEGGDLLVLDELLVDLLQRESVESVVERLAEAAVRRVAVAQDRDQAYLLAIEQRRPHRHQPGGDARERAVRWSGDAATDDTVAARGDALGPARDEHPYRGGARAGAKAGQASLREGRSEL